MLSRYFPRDVTMHSYRNGTSTATRNDNWEQLQRACRKHGFAVPKDLVHACKAEEFGAAAAVLELLYEHFTQRQIRRPIEVRTGRLCIGTCAHGCQFALYARWPAHGKGCALGWRQARKRLRRTGVRKVDMR